MPYSKVALSQYPAKVFIKADFVYLSSRFILASFLKLKHIWLPHNNSIGTMLHLVESSMLPPRNHLDHTIKFSTADMIGAFSQHFRQFHL